MLQPVSQRLRPCKTELLTCTALTVWFAGQLQLGMLPYAWTKHSLLMLGQGLEGELAGSGVKVFTICPGVFDIKGSVNVTCCYDCTMPSSQ